MERLSNFFHFSLYILYLKPFRNFLAVIVLEDFVQHGVIQFVGHQHKFNLHPWHTVLALGIPRFCLNSIECRWYSALSKRPQIVVATRIWAENWTAHLASRLSDVWFLLSATNHYTELPVLFRPDPNEEHSYQDDQVLHLISLCSYHCNL